MHIQEYHHYDRTHWAHGPWDDEPDEIQWVDAATSLPCMMRRSPHGNWYGYVGVTAMHPHFGSAYTEIEDRVDIDVHGGLTFASVAQSLRDNHAPTGYWWFGFYCAHAWDLQGFTEPTVWAIHQRSPIDDEVYRDVEYVMEECRQLAQQLHAMAEVPA